MLLELKSWLIAAGVVTLVIGGAAAMWRYGDRRSQLHTEMLRDGLHAARVAQLNTIG